ncbi:AAA family ATPase, partial [Candidatus Woesearchaeota archaeon]|nr:AAA family ATPase [Candidatus Woesearchaeota archaeon]
MALFKDMLRSNESVFKDTVALDFDYLPKILPFREIEQRQFAAAIKPLFNKQNGRNLFVYGAPGIGKTTACRHVLRELEEETDEIFPLYVNCWKYNTTFKVLTVICDALNFKFIQNRKSHELAEMIKSKLNKAMAVFVFDEVDKAEELDFLYMLSEDIYRKSIILITNPKGFYEQIDHRLRSRLTAEMLYFRPYNKEEIKGILKHRLGYAFQEGVWDEPSFEAVVEKTAELNDLRTGLYIMREAGQLAEDRAERKISLGQVGEAIRKAEEFTIKEKDELEGERSEMEEDLAEQNILKSLQLVQKNSVAAKQNQKEDLLKKTKGQEAAYQEMIKDNQEDIVYIKEQLTLLEKYN